MNAHIFTSAHRLPWLAALVAMTGVEVVRARRVARMSAALEAAEHRAEADPLTGLHNRAGMGARVDEAIARYGAAGLLLVDLNGFKAVNDTYGHGVGDAVLAEVGRRLAGALLPGEVAARHGGDEFSVLLTVVSPTAPGSWIQRRADAVAVAASGPVSLDDGLRVDVTASVGAAVAASARELWEAADAAMYGGKRMHHAAGATASEVAR